MLYLERGGELREMENAEEIRAICLDAGFTPIRAGQLSLAEQARIFNGADVMVGVKGADFANVLFGREDAAIVLLSPGDYPEPLFWDLAAHVGVDYFEIFGPVTSRGAETGRNPFRIDPSRFRIVLEAALARLRPDAPKAPRRYGMERMMQIGYCSLFDA